jgi:protein-S-isoprenylcysteine O-methyltransferase Ste14
MRGPIQKDQKGWDKVFTVSTIPVFIAFVVVLGFDAVRYEWSDTSFAVKVAGFAAMPPMMILTFLVMRENTFLSKAVKIQEGHRVVTTGPYAVVRHPLYVAVILLMVSMPLALGSLYALIPAGVLIVMMLIRTALEDRTLYRELPGYPEYAQRVRYRLLPGVW